MRVLSQFFFVEMGYMKPRQLEDGTWVALVPLMFTTGICMGLNQTGYTKRYCYGNTEKCLEEYKKLKSYDDVPEGWIAKRPEND